MLYGIYSIKHYFFRIINEIFSLMAQLRQAPATHIYTYIYIHKQTKSHTHITHTHSHPNMHTHTNAHQNTHVRIYIRSHRRSYTYIHIHTQQDTHTYTHMQTQTHTHSQHDSMGVRLKSLIMTASGFERSPWQMQRCYMNRPTISFVRTARRFITVGAI